MKEKKKISEEQALFRLAAYCSKAERAESDVRKKLLLWEFDEEVQNRVLKHLKQENYLSEIRFCKSFVNDKMRFNKWGRNKIIFELKKKRIPDSLINQTFENLEVDNFDETLNYILTNKQKTVKGKDEYDKRNKLIRFGLSRGYTMDQVIKCVNKLTGTSDDDF